MLDSDRTTLSWRVQAADRTEYQNHLHTQTNSAIIIESRLWLSVSFWQQLFWWLIIIKLESSQSPHTSAKAMLFAKWQHHLRFSSGFPYAPLKAMVTKISKWSRIQDSFRITPKNWITGSLCHSRHSQRISERSVHNFLSYLADT